MDEILAFHKSRTHRHIAAVNYFAGLMGYHFPKHDYDKFNDPIQVGYSYINYTNYHPDCKISQQYADAFKKANHEHHSTQPHHIEYYKNVQNIPHDVLIEMVCDWCSANFEQSNILHNNEFGSVIDFFDKQLSQLNWTDKQRETIIQTINFMEQNAAPDKLYAIWADII